MINPVAGNCSLLLTSFMRVPFCLSLWKSTEERQGNKAHEPFFHRWRWLKTGRITSVSTLKLKQGVSMDS